MLNFKLELVDYTSPTLDDEASLVDSSDGLLHNKLQHGFCLHAFVPKISFVIMFFFKNLCTMQIIELHKDIITYSKKLV